MDSLHCTTSNPGSASQDHADYAAPTLQHEPYSTEHTDHTDHIRIISALDLQMMKWNYLSGLPDVYQVPPGKYQGLTVFTFSCAVSAMGTCL